MSKHPSNFIDLTGKEFEYFTVLRQGNGRYTKGGQYKATWICKCCCGNEFEVDAQTLKNGTVVSCGCKRYSRTDKRVKEDITGQRFGRLTVIGMVPREERTSRKKVWRCRCDCGNYIDLEIGKLKTGHTQSCGCLKEEYKEKIGNLNKKYEHSGDKKLYGIYKAMIGRCYDSTNKRFPKYGGRGIKVCEEWQGEYGYDAFAEWALSHGREDNLTLDRIDVNGDYEPNNCRWISNQEQQYNKQGSIKAEYNGEVKDLAQWGRDLNISYSALYYRYVIKNMSMAQIVAEFK